MAQLLTINGNISVVKSTVPGSQSLSKGSIGIWVQEAIAIRELKAKLCKEDFIVQWFCG